MVEVSVALAEALVLEREGAALKRRGAAGASLANEAQWDDKTEGANQRRIQLLSESLFASEVHDLQVLRNSLERQAADEAVPEDRSGPAGIPPRQGTVAMIPRDEPQAGTADVELRDRDAEWHADVLLQRSAAVSRAVERKGGWRSAVLLEDGNVNIDADVNPWPATDGVLMLQTVKSALVVQLEEV